MRLWNTSDPAAPTPLTGHNGSVNSVAFSPDGNILASTGGLPSTVRLWNLIDPAAPTPIGSPLTGHNALLSAVAFAPEGNILATAGSDGVRLWDLSGLIELRVHAMERACAITGGGLTRDEWARYVPGLEYVDVCKDVTRPR